MREYIRKVFDKEHFEKYVGSRFGNLVVSRIVGGPRSSWLLHCECDCGGSISVSKRNLGKKGRISCGCLEKSKDITGKIFGGLTVIGRGEPRISGNKSGTLLCRCICGKECNVRRTSLVLGERTCCGCINRINPRPGMKYADRLDAKVGHILATTKNGARGRGLSFSLSPSEFREIVLSVCNYCGEFSKLEVFDGVEVGICGVDRLDNSRGYEVDNSVPCCWSCNDMKRDREFYDFLYKVRDIYENLSLDELPDDIGVYGS